jgi:hypothetical protein
MSSVSSSIIPELIECGANNNFVKYEPLILEHLLLFGESGQEIIKGVRFDGLVEPCEADVNEDGSLKYKVSDAGVLTAAASIKFGRDLDRHWLSVEKRTKHAAGAFTYLMSLLSSASKDALGNVDDGALVSAKEKLDAFALWQLILKTHTQGSGRAQQRHFVSWLNLRQTTTHDTYVREIRDAMKLVAGSFESKDHKGYISIDSIAKVFYMNGLDQALFDRPLNRLMEEDDKKDFSFNQSVQLCQAFYLDRAVHPVANTIPLAGPSAVIGKALAAPITSVVSTSVRTRLEREEAARQRKLLLGPYDPSSSYCEHCWSNGFKNQHSKVSCSHYISFLARKSSQRGAPRALVAADISSVVPVVPPVAVTAAVPSMSSDQQLVM